MPMKGKTEKKMKEKIGVGDLTRQKSQCVVESSRKKTLIWDFWKLMRERPDR